MTNWNKKKNPFVQWLPNKLNNDNDYELKLGA